MLIARGKYALVLMMLYFFCTDCYGQDSTYVSKFRHDFSIAVSSYNNFTILKQKLNDDQEISYRPNNPMGLNFALSWQGTTLSLGYAFDFFRDKRKGKTESTDFQYHYYGRKVILDFYFQRYKGFYREVDKQDDDFTLHPDIRIRQYGLHGQYVFNGNKFSTSAAFNQNQRQLRSTGSWLVGGGIYYNKLDTDYSLIFDDNSVRLNNFQIGLNVGYSYTWVFRKGYYVSGAVSGGLAFGAKSFDRLTKDRLEVYPLFFPRLGMGYNADNWSVGITFIMNRVYVAYTSQSDISLETGCLKVSFSKRFDTLPILSKLLGKEKPKILFF